MSHTSTIHVTAPAMFASTPFACDRVGGIESSGLVRIGTPNSSLAQIQAESVARLLLAAHPGVRLDLQTVAVRGDVVKSTPFLLMKNSSGATDVAKNI